MLNFENYWLKNLCISKSYWKILFKMLYILILSLIIEIDVKWFGPTTLQLTTGKNEKVDSLHATAIRFIG